MRLTHCPASRRHFGGDNAADAKAGPRASIRFPSASRGCVLWWTDENGNRQQAEGSSRDISERGAFVFAATCPPVGSSVELRIPLEGLPDTTGIDLAGSVVRVEQAHNGKGSQWFRSV